MKRVSVKAALADYDPIEPGARQMRTTSTNTGMSRRERKAIAEMLERHGIDAVVEEVAVFAFSKIGVDGLSGVHDVWYRLINEARHQISVVKEYQCQH